MVNPFVFGVIAAFAAEFVVGFLVILVVGCVDSIKRK